ncbi:hypothetical protein K6119_16735 [Paracrocinitomix mangrovi]|uniref:hypothetical protein n=1 Tax=Paracrocinitomix mangrovi TaxID=2862509 RepID=UPI001C8D9937|nr:hypothetical protein [Paracrocinitomix mangrovi]UKN01374.1 hypothetical protein K6119_16735 [Paracrocinitomix mangrovi]
MNWGLLFTGFGLGTFKFLFAQWLTYTPFHEYINENVEIGVLQIFISVTIGAWFSMTIFYFLSELLMIRAHKKRKKARQDAIDKGIPFKEKKKFTKMNKFIVWVKRKIGIYGVTFLAPLFLSIPIGSIVCAKFYGKKRRTFPLMMIFTASYSALICLWIYSTIA